MKILSTLIRVYVEKSELDQTIQFYESLYQQKCSLRFSYEEKNLELAMIDHTS
jgi:pentatricopeptide repeat protein